jgi:Fe-Mn family superoxide dismutase
MSKKFDPAVLPVLPYALSALEPILITEVLEIHYGKHHQKYVDEYNKWAQLLEDAMNQGDSTKIQKCLDMVHFNAGGHNAHTLYWENLAPISNGGGVLPDDSSLLTKAIVQNWGSYQNFITQFNAVSAGIMGSGWAWLAFSPDSKQISICYTEKHDSVEEDGKIPLLTVDVWEHAYYLQYKNLKLDYFAQIWKIINWKTVEQRYLKALNP